MRVDWKIKGPPIPRWQYGCWAVLLLLYVAYLWLQGRPELWGVFGFQAAFLFGGLVMAKRGKLPFGSGFVEFDGDRLDFIGNSGGPWCLADVDSVMIQDRLIQIRVYRSGGMGDEFTARAELMSAEDWEKLTALCRKIQAGIKPGALPYSNNLEEVA